MVRTPIKSPLLLLWILYGCFIVYGTLIPFDISLKLNNFSQIIDNLFSFTLDSLLSHASKMDIISNFLLFIPWGFLTVALLHRLSNKWLLPAVAGIIFSTSISFIVEILQSYSPSRTSSLGDTIINTLGGGAGVLLALIYFLIFHDKAKEKWEILFHEKPVLLITLLLGFGIYLGGLFPFDFSIQISELKQALKNMEWIPFSPKNADSIYIASLGADFLIFGAFAGLCHFSMRLYAVSITTFFVPVLMLTIGLAGLVEFSQLFIVSRTTDNSDLIIALFAAFIGSYFSIQIERFLLHRSLASNSPQRTNLPSNLKWLIFFIYGLSVAYLLISPLEFDFSREQALAKVSIHQLVPFYAYWIRTDFFALQDLLFTTLLFIPFGAITYFCLKSFVLPRLITFLLGMIFISIIEFLQFFQPGRYPDITDILSATIGTILGILVVHKFTSSKAS